MTIVFETHSTSVDNELHLASGHHDANLSARGEREAVELGARRADDRFDAIYASDLRRSWRTAEIAFAGRGIPIIRDARLRECDYGRLSRFPIEQVTALSAQAVSEPFPEGESYVQTTARVAEWLDDVQAQRVSRILVIGHRATRFALEHLILGLPLDEVVTKPFAWQPGWTYEVRGFEL